MLGKHFYEVSTREEGHVFTLLIYFLEFGAEARYIAASSLCVYISLSVTAFHHLSLLIDVECTLQILFGLLQKFIESSSAKDSLGPS